MIRYVTVSNEKKKKKKKKPRIASSGSFLSIPIIFLLFCSNWRGNKRGGNQVARRHVATIPGHLSAMKFPSAHPVHV